MAEETALKIGGSDVWFLDIIFLCPDKALYNLTPAEVAGIKYSYRNWLDIVRKGLAPVKQARS